MTRKKLRLDELEVDSFRTDAEKVLAEKQERKGSVRAYDTHLTYEPDTCYNNTCYNPCNTYDYSCLNDNTARCDTDRDCSRECLVVTNVCGPCE